MQWFIFLLFSLTFKAILNPKTSSTCGDSNPNKDGLGLVLTKTAVQVHTHEHINTKSPISEDSLLGCFRSSEIISLAYGVSCHDTQATQMNAVKAQVLCKWVFRDDGNFLLLRCPRTLHQAVRAAWIRFLFPLCKVTIRRSQNPFIHSIE